jgi:hypothetical protein
LLGSGRQKVEIVVVRSSNYWCKTDKIEDKCNFVLQNISMTGTIGEIRFDSDGDLIGAIEVFQYQRVLKGAENAYEAVKIGSSANVARNASVLNVTMLQWKIFGENGNSSIEAKPESSCSRPCKVGEYAAQLGIICCWECKQCPENGDVSILLVTLSCDSY